MTEITRSAFVLAADSAAVGLFFMLIGILLVLAMWQLLARDER